MNDQNRPTHLVPRFSPAAGVPASQAQALERRLTLEAQQRGYQQHTYPQPHLFRRRPPG